jgi:hypothetical protein
MDTSTTSGIRHRRIHFREANEKDPLLTSSTTTSSSSTFPSTSTALIPSTQPHPTNWRLQETTYNIGYKLAYGLDYLWVSLLYLPSSLSLLLGPVMTYLGKTDPVVEQRIKEQILMFRSHVNQVSFPLLSFLFISLFFLFFILFSHSPSPPFILPTTHIKVLRFNTNRT